MMYMLGNCVCKIVLYGLRLMCIDMCMVDEVVGEYMCNSSVCIHVEEDMTSDMVEEYHKR